MTIKIRTFGRITEIVGFSESTLNEVRDTQKLLDLLHEKFPELQNLKCLIAVNKKQIWENTPLHDQDEVAVMPPFSGG